LSQTTPTFTYTSLLPLLTLVRSYRGDLISQAEIRNKVDMCDHDVPVIALGGGSIDPAPPVATEVDSSAITLTLALALTLTPDPDY